MAVGDKHKNNFMSNLVDAFTKDAADHYEGNRRELMVDAWAKENVFMQRLQKGLREHMTAAIKNYGNRIMARLKLNPDAKIKDNLFEIVEYVTSIPSFIKTLLDNLKAVPPFQV